MKHSDLTLGIIGLGYVGLPLAVEFGRKRSVIGFDKNQKRISELKSGQDLTKELTSQELSAAKHLKFSARIQDLEGCKRTSAGYAQGTIWPQQQKMGQGHQGPYQAKNRQGREN